MNDPVNHPSHYKNAGPDIECIEVTRHFNFNRGNAIKYIWRAGAKDPAKTIEDLEKARWYLANEIMLATLQGAKKRLQEATVEPSTDDVLDRMRGRDSNMVQRVADLVQPALDES